MGRMNSAFFTGTEGLRLNLQAIQIKQSVTNDLPLVQHFCEKSFVACSALTQRRFGVMQRVH